MRSTEWRPRYAACQFGSHRGAAIGELAVVLHDGMAQIEHPSEIGRVVVAATTLLLLLSCWWTLQAFMPEPYFLRTPYQLRVMSTPNGLGQIERSLSPFYATAAAEAVALGALALFAWRSRTAVPALCYLCAVIVMAVITLMRVAEAFRGLH